MCLFVNSVYLNVLHVWETLTGMEKSITEYVMVENAAEELPRQASVGENELEENKWNGTTEVCP